MTAALPHKDGDERCLCICSQATPGDARIILDAMNRTQAGSPAAGDLALAMVKARRTDLFGLLQEQNPGFSLEEEMRAQGREAMAALTRALAVGVGNGEFNQLDAELEERTGAHIVTAGLLSLDTLLSLDSKDQNRNTSGPTSASTVCRWIMGKPFNPGLTMGLLRGALAAGVDPEDARWQNLLNLAAQQAMDRCACTHQRKNPALDALIEFTLERLGPGDDVTPTTPTANAVMKLHGMRKEDGGRWPRARAACDRMVSRRVFCEAVASTPMQVRAWSRLCETSDIVDPDIFERAGSVPEAMGSLAAFAIRTIGKELMNKAREPLSAQDWDEGERFRFTVALVKELEWMEKFLNQNLQTMDGDTSRLPEALGCVHGKGPETKSMSAMITQRLEIPAQEKEDIGQFIERLQSVFSMMQMDEGTHRTRGPGAASPRF